MTSPAGAADPASGQPRTRKGVQSRMRLVDAAKVVFAERGFLEARITDITAAAGLSHGSFYSYFDSKEALLREVAQSLVDQLYAPLDVELFSSLSPEDPRGQIREGNRAFLERYREQAPLLREVDRATHLDEQLQLARFTHQKRYGKAVATSLRRLQRRGLADPSVDPVLAAHAIGAMASRFADLWALQEVVDCSLDDAVRQLTTLMCNALGVPVTDDGPSRSAKRT